MKIKFLGSGSAFTRMDENFNSNMLITVDGKNLLFDCGSTINEALNYHNLEVKDLDTIYISHNHADHSSIEYIAFSSYFTPTIDKINLVGNVEVLETLWDHSASGGLKSLQNKTTTLETYFNTEYIDGASSFMFQDITFKLLQTIHVQDDRRIVPSYGLYFTVNDKKILITGDTQLSNNLYSFYNNADMIFQDCEFADYRGSVHAQYRELKELDTLTKRKMYLYHYSLNGKSFEELEAEVLTDGFGGLVARGQEFKI